VLRSRPATDDCAHAAEAELHLIKFFNHIDKAVDPPSIRTAAKHPHHFHYVWGRLNRPAD